MALPPWRQFMEAPKSLTHIDQIDKVLTDNMANTNEFHFDLSYLDIECMKALLERRGIPFQQHDTENALLDRFSNAIHDVQIPTPDTSHLTQNSFFEILGPEMRKKIFKLAFGDQFFHVTPDDSTVWNQRKSCVGQHWSQYFDERDWDMLLESPVNKLFVSKQWYEETKNIFWEESMLDITNLTRGPVTLKLKKKAVLRYGKLRLDLKSLMGCRIEQINDLLKHFPRLNEIRIQCRTETIKELYARKEDAKGLRYCSWGELTVFGKNRNYPSFGLPPIKLYEDFEIFWTIAKRLELKKIRFEHVVAVQEAEDEYIEDMMRWFRKRILRKTGGKVTVSLAGEWIPEYDFDENEAMLLGEYLVGKIGLLRVVKVTDYGHAEEQRG